MAERELIQLERQDDGVALIRLDNGKVNSLSTSLLAELAAVVAELRADLPGAVVITGSDRMFAAGADITELGDLEQARVVTAAFRTALDQLAALPRMSIAAVAGFALGGGCELALACDMRIASETSRFGLPEVLLGVIPGGGGTQRLARLIGAARAKELVLTGRQVRADEALAIGLVNQVVPADEVLPTALKVAAGLATGALAAQGLAKRAIDGGLDMSLPEGLTYEQELFVEVFETDDAAIGVQSFLEEGPGKARFTGR